MVGLTGPDPAEEYRDAMAERGEQMYEEIKIGMRCDIHFRLEPCRECKDLADGYVPDAGYPGGER